MLKLADKHRDPAGAVVEARLPYVLGVMVIIKPVSSSWKEPTEPTRHCNGPDEPVTGQIAKGLVHEEPQLQRFVRHVVTLVNDCGVVCRYVKVVALAWLYCTCPGASAQTYDTHEHAAPSESGL